MLLVAAGFRHLLQLNVTQKHAKHIESFDQMLAHGHASVLTVPCNHLRYPEKLGASPSSVEDVGQSMNSKGLKTVAGVAAEGGEMWWLVSEVKVDDIEQKSRISCCETTDHRSITLTA